MGNAELLEFVRQQCERYGVVLYLGEGADVPCFETTACSGYFDENGPVLAVAIGKPEEEYTAILVHEYCHMMQWVESSRVWIALGESCTMLDQWLSGINFDDRIIQTAIDRIIDVEVDCERRSVEFIREHGINIDVEQYTQRANSYVLFYNYIRMTRKWYDPDRKPYNVETVWRMMPTEFQTDNYTLTSQQLNAFHQLGLTNS